MPARLARQVSSDLEDIYNYDLGRWGEEQAERYAEAFWRAVAQIEEFPLASRLRSEVRSPVRVYRFQSHLIIYEIERENDGVLILRIAHARSDWARNLV